MREAELSVSGVSAADRLVLDLVKMIQAGCGVESRTGAVRMVARGTGFSGFGSTGRGAIGLLIESSLPNFYCFK